MGRSTSVRPMLCAAILITALVGMTGGGSAAKRTWDFEAETEGSPAKGFSSEVGRWAVVRDGMNHVLAQLAKNDDATFNVALVEGTRYKDLDVSVKMKAVAGETDRGGGLVWRARD